MHYIPPLIFTWKVSIWEFLGTPWVFQSGLITLPSNTPCTLRWRAVSTAGICNNNINNISSTCTQTNGHSREQTQIHWSSRTMTAVNTSLQPKYVGSNSSDSVCLKYAPLTLPLLTYGQLSEALSSIKQDWLLSCLTRAQKYHLYYCHLNFHVFYALWCYFTFLLMVLHKFFGKKCVFYTQNSHVHDGSVNLNSSQTS